ncbi:hypothetical protein BTHE_1982 [Bifidobacterium thermophilum]|nr:hypothetical protein BTHE_1982 [Bifidobacterium thermophilum]
MPYATRRQARFAHPKHSFPLAPTTPRASSHPASHALHPRTPHTPTPTHLSHPPYSSPHLPHLPAPLRPHVLPYAPAPPHCTLPARFPRTFSRFASSRAG